MKVPYCAPSGCQCLLLLLFICFFFVFQIGGHVCVFQWRQRLHHHPSSVKSLAQQVSGKCVCVCQCVCVSVCVCQCVCVSVCVCV